MRILLTGVTGFAGGHLAEALLARPDSELFGLGRRRQWPEEWRQLAERVPLHTADLCDGAAVEAVLRKVQPEQIYHLAGYAQVGRSFQEPDAAWAGNLTATRCLYDAVCRWGGRPRVLFVGSGLIYGDPDTPEQAHDEDAVLRPTTPYAASKAAADLLSYQYTRSAGLEIIRARPYNHIGPHQSPQFAIAHFAKQIIAIERGRQPALLETGNLSPRRDLTDVRDTVRAYVLLMANGRGGEAYNVGTGRLHAIGEVLQRLIALARARAEVRQRDDLLRPTDTVTVRANPAKLRRETGWTPACTLDQTLMDTLAYWREQP